MKSKQTEKIGIIGGSGLYQIEALKDAREVALATPFGRPSGKFVVGRLEGRDIVFLARHGKGHTLLPGEINYRANIYAMKQLGVTRIISVSAVGSMKKEIVPCHIVIPDQFYDLTKGRKSSFFGEGIVAHVSFADPICPQLAQIVTDAGRLVGATVHKGGIYICMEGPQFSTRAESEVHRGFGVSVIGMTNATEAKLAREAEICYVTVALATDYDCWHQSETAVTTEMVIRVLLANVALSKKMIQAAVAGSHPVRNCACGEALKNAIMTDKKMITSAIKKKLAPIIGKYISQKGKEIK